MKERCWKTLDGRVIPIKYMTTTHLSNAMHHSSKLGATANLDILLPEWHKREKESVWTKATRFFGRVTGNYYKGSTKFGVAQKKKFQELYDEISTRA